MLKHIGISTIIGLVLAATAMAQPTCEIVWKAEAKGGLSAPNALIDPTTGQTLGFIVAERDTGVVRFDLQGNRVWEYPMEPPVGPSPAVADLNGDGRENIVGVDSKGNVVALDADGQVLWKGRAPAGVEGESCPAIADLDEDGSLEVLTCDTSGTISCFASDGRPRWRFSADGTEMGPVLVADIYDTPGREVIAASHDQHIYALTAQGEWLWDMFCIDGMFPASAPILADTNGDQVPELYLGTCWNHLFGIDLQKREIFFAQDTSMHVSMAVQGADLDNDGRDEIVFGSKAAMLYCYGDGGIRWTHDLPGSMFLSGMLFADVAGDPTLEVLACGGNRALNILDAKGDLLVAHTLPVSVRSTPMLGDFDGDGNLDMIATAARAPEGQPGMAWISLAVPYCENPNNRLCLMNDRAHTGMAPGAKTYPPLPAPRREPGASQASVAEVGENRLFEGSNTWRFDVTNSGEDRLAFVASIEGPDGHAQRGVRHIGSARERTAITFQTTQPGAYRTSYALLEPDSMKELAGETRTISFAGFEGDKHFLSAEIFPEIEAQLISWRENNLVAADCMERELLACKGILSALDGMEPASRSARAVDLRESALRLRTLVRAGAALAPSGSFFTWGCSPWAHFDGQASLPEPDDAIEGLQAFLCIGEYRSLALNLTNLSNRFLHVRALCDEMEEPDGTTVSARPYVEFRQAVTSAALRREVVADALPRLDEAHLLSIPSLESSQLWITVNAKDLAPGTYVAHLRLKSVETDPTEIALPIAITVHDLALPRPHPLRMCLWPMAKGDLDIENDYVLEDLIEHGSTVYFGQAPKATCNAQGELVDNLDFTEHDRLIRRFFPHGFILFMHPMPMLSGEPMLSEPWRKAYVTYLRAWVAHMKELGLDYEGWALYPSDEPSAATSSSTLLMVQMGELIREADPNILIYTDPTCGTTFESLELYKHLVDIWCPSNQLLDRFRDGFLKVARATGGEIWNYDARGRAKTLSTLAHYRWWFWNVWNQSFTGAGWYTYSHHAPNQDLWDGPNPSGDYFCTVYPGPGAVVTSKRWEATREGIQDYEYLYLLREAIREARERGVSEERLAEANELLTNLPVKMEETLRSSGERLVPTPDSVVVYEEVSARIDEARARIVAAILDVKQMTP